MGFIRKIFPLYIFALGFAWLFQSTPGSSDEHAYYPVRKEVSGLSAYIRLLAPKQVKDAKALFNLYGGSPSADKSVIGSRYLYSTKWGWLDLRHFSAAAYYSEKWYLSGHAVLTFGELKEFMQSRESSASAFDYEDFVSNLLGVFFGTKYARDGKKTYVANLHAYLKNLGFVDQPLSIAPNADQVPKTYSLKPGEIEKSHDYNPRHTKFGENDLNGLDREVMAYRKSYLGSLLVQ